MSTIQVSNISDGTTSVPAEVVTEAAPKAHAVYQHRLNTISRTYNVSSITDNVAQPQFNFTNNFDAADYGLTAWAESDDTSNAVIVSSNNNDSYGTSGRKVTTRDTSPAAVDAEIICPSFFGDLA